MRILIVLLFLPVASWSQVITRSYVDERNDYNHLENWPTSFKCEGSGDYKVFGNFYRNNMPMADNEQVNWFCWLSMYDDAPVDIPCTSVEVRAYYLFYEDVVAIFEVSAYGKEQKMKIYSAPEYVVIEYYNKTEKKLGYVRSPGSFVIGTVE